MEEIKTSSDNPFPELQATLVHLPYGMKLIVNSLAKATSPIISGHLRGWMRRSRCPNIVNLKEDSRMNAWRLAPSGIRLSRKAACSIQAVNIARGSVLESKEHQQLVGPALLRQFWAVYLSNRIILSSRCSRYFLLKMELYYGEMIITCYDQESHDCKSHFIRSFMIYQLIDDVMVFTWV